ncbi:MAG: RNA polymerase sigma factor [Terriglobia bacterium]
MKKHDLLSSGEASDAAALASLYDRLSPEIRGILQRILPSPEEAEEVLEATFVGLWKQERALGKSAASQDAWMFLAARTEAVRRLRATRGLSDLNVPPGSPEVASRARAQEMSVLQSRRDLLRRSLTQLPAAQRRVLDLIINEGLTEAEIAAELHEPLGKVRDQVRAAMAFARQRLHTLMGTWTAGI